MVDEKQIASLSAETLAVQFVLTNVLLEVGKLDPILQLGIRRGLKHAAHDVEGLAMVGAAGPDFIVKARRFIEDMRAALDGDKGPSLVPIDNK